MSSQLQMLETETQSSTAHLTGTSNEQDKTLDKKPTKEDDDFYESDDDDVGGAFGSPIGSTDYFKTYKIHNRNASKLQHEMLSPKAINNVINESKEEDYVDEILVIDYEKETFKYTKLPYGQECEYSTTLDKYFAKIEDNQRKTLFTTIHIDRISDIDNIKECFRCNFWISLSWLPTFFEYKEYMLAKKNSDLMDWKPHWVPIISFPEQLRCWHMGFSDMGKEFGKFKIAELKSDIGKSDELGYNPDKCEFIRCKLECDIIFSSPFFLEHFPVDSQDLAIKILEKSGLCEFKPETRRKHFATATTVSSIMEEWSFHNMLTEVGLMESINLAQIKIRLKIRRRFEVYLYNIVIYMGMISGLVMVSFAVDDTAMGERLGIIITLLLTSVAYQSNLSIQLPNVPYLTLLDKYIIVCFMYMGAVGIATALLSQSFFDEDKNNDEFFYISLAIYILYHIIFLIVAISYKKLENKKLYASTTEMNKLMHLKSKKLEVDWRQSKPIGSNWMIYSASDVSQIKVLQRTVTRKKSIF